MNQGRPSLHPRASLAALFCLAAACAAPATPPPTLPTPEPPDAGAAAPRLRLATFNVRRFFDTTCQTGACTATDYEELPTPAQFDARADQLAAAIRTFGAQVVVLQEVETQACLDALLARLSDVLPSGALGEIGSPASVDVAVLSAAPITQVVRHRDVPLVRADGTITFFSREFLEVHTTLLEHEVIVFAAHFRSKVSDDPERRLLEAQAARGLVEQTALATPPALVVLGGDLNDVPGSPPLDALEDGGTLLRVARDRPVGAQATYVYFGAPQAIDHLFQAVSGAGTYVPGSAHVLAGNPGYGGSDHRPLLADFEFR